MSFPLSEPFCARIIHKIVGGNVILADSPKVGRSKPEVHSFYFFFVFGAICDLCLPLGIKLAIKELDFVLLIFLRAVKTFMA